MIAVLVTISCGSVNITLQPMGIIARTLTSFLKAEDITRRYLCERFFFFEGQYCVGEISISGTGGTVVINCGCD